MENFMISFNAVFPIALMMALGFFLKSIRLLSDATVKQFNAVVFKVFLPVMIFKNVYDSVLTEVFNAKLIIFSAVSVVVCIAILYIIIPLIEKDNAKRGVLIQAIFRSNFVIFGVPVTEALCGQASMGIASILIAIVIPIFNFSAVITLEVFKGKKPNFVKIVKGIITNPLIIGSVLGIVVNVIGLKFPTIIEKSIGNVSSITTPMALIMLGASINIKSIGKNVWYILGGVLSRLVIVPAICLAFAIFMFGFRGSELAVLLTLFASPAAVSSFTMAQQMGGDDELAGQLVMFGTIASIITMFLWIFVLVQTGLVFVK